MSNPEITLTVTDYEIKLKIILIGYKGSQGARGK